MITYVHYALNVKFYMMVLTLSVFHSQDGDFLVDEKEAPPTTLTICK